MRLLTLLEIIVTIALVIGVCVKDWYIIIACGLFFIGLSIQDIASVIKFDL